MEPPPNSFYKNARDHKRHKDKIRNAKQRDKHTNENEKSSQSNTDSKPQRTNRRERGEPSPMPKVADNEVIENKTESSVAAKVVNEETIDHSHLKRETEEIDKLTQKNYSRRQITSNWERYRVPEVVGRPEEEDEFEAADFASLLKFPLSYGGHLKLKEEKSWGAESEAILNNYLALDLNLLAQGLDCIPFYQRHQLSTDLFSKEELEQMQATARQNEELYKLKKDTKSDPNTQLQSTNINENIIKILTQKEELHIDALGLTDSIIEADEKKNFINIENNSDEEVIGEDEEDKLSNKIEQMEDILTSEMTNIEQPSILVNNSMENVPTLKLNTDNVEIRNIENVPTLQIHEKITVNNVIVSRNLESESSLIVSQQCAEKINDQISPSVINTSQIDDDEELDFLLSLKQPVNEHTKPKKTNVDTSVIVGGVYSPETITKTDVASTPQSELDNWLDSFLED